jgi:DNA-binding transcriptional ArsR family regulator
MEKRSAKNKLPTIEKPMQSVGDFEDCATRLKALADPERLRIVSCLFGGPKNVSQLAGELDDDVVKVSHHLGVLRHANVVITHKQGKFVVYSLHPQITGPDAVGIKTLDLGCCRLDLPKPGRDA